MVGQVHLVSPSDIVDGVLDRPILAEGGVLDDAVVVVDLDQPISAVTAVAAAATAAAAAAATTPTASSSLPTSPSA